VRRPSTVVADSEIGVVRTVVMRLLLRAGCLR
jgi:hypothetical protein